jgi:hypothetical protein
MTQSWDSYIVIKGMLRHILGGYYSGICAARRGQVTLHERSDSFMAFVLVELKKNEISMSF